MTETTKAPAQDDIRFAYAHVTQAVRSLMESVDESQLQLTTPCEDFVVKDMLEHLVLVMRRAAAVGRGEHFSTTQQVAQDSGWVESFTSAAHEVMEAWTDDAKLGEMFEVPWGTMPGIAILTTYTGELAVHGWDLATAIGAEFTIPDEILAAPLEGSKFIPAEGRDDQAVPFGPVVIPGPGASALEQMAGWMGRAVA